MSNGDIYFISKVLNEYQWSDCCKKETQVKIFDFIVKLATYKENDDLILNKDELSLLEDALWHYEHKHFCTEWNILKNAIDILKEEK